MFDWLKRLGAARGVERKLLAWHAPGRPVWSSRDPGAFAREGYARNAIAYRCVRLIAEAAASAPLKVGPSDHPLARLLARPNPEQTGVELLEAFYGHLQVSGNAFLEAAVIEEEAPSELYVLRPDRMSVVPGADGWPVGWEHRVGASVRRFERDPVSGDAPILHLKLFHPSDARPYAAFPARTDVWSDGGSWRLGHWLNGRAGLSGLGEVVLDLCARAGAEGVDVSTLSGAVSGYVVDAPATARGALEPLMAAYDFVAAERAGVLSFFHADVLEPLVIGPADFTAEVGDLYAERADAAVQPIEARVRFLDAARNYLIAGVSARRLDRADGGVISVDAPLVLEPETAEALAQVVLADHRAAAETLSIALGPAHLALEPGDRVTLAAGDVFEIARIEDAEARRLELKRKRAAFPTRVRLADLAPPPNPAVAPTPAFALLDLPPLPGAESEQRPLAATFASPWLGAHTLHAGSDVTLLGERARVTQAAIMGELLWALPPGPVDRWDEGNVVRVQIYGGALASETSDAVLDGANSFAIESDDGEFELIQVRSCVLVEPGVYELSGFLRGQLGSAHAIRAPHPIGARVVKLDDKLVRADIGAHEWGEPLLLSAPPQGGAANDARAAQATVTFPHAATRPWAPAHLRAVREADDDIAIGWVRCARAGGDAWSAGEPPFGEPAESYLLEILDGADVVRSVTTASTVYVYPAADQVADFGSLPGSLQIQVAQISANGVPGLKAALTIAL